MEISKSDKIIGMLRYLGLTEQQINTLKRKQKVTLSEKQILDIFDEKSSGDLEFDMATFFQKLNVSFD